MSKDCWFCYEHLAVVHDCDKSPSIAEGLLRRVAASGVEYDEPRIDYVVIQMDRDLWTAIQAWAKEGK